MKQNVEHKKLVSGQKDRQQNVDWKASASFVQRIKEKDTGIHCVYGSKIRATDRFKQKKTIEKCTVVKLMNATYWIFLKLR